MGDVAYVVTESDESYVYFAASPDEAWLYWTQDHCGCDEGECSCNVEIDREPRFDQYVSAGIPVEAFRDAGWKRPCQDCIKIEGLSPEVAMCGTGDWVVHEGSSLCHDCLRERQSRERARLLAAAPEMLATIKALAEVVQCLSTSKDATYLPVDRILGLAESVIAKATEAGDG